MNSKMMIVMLVQLICVCAPLSRPAIALDRNQDQQSLEGIGSQLSETSFTYKMTLREKDRRYALIRDQDHMCSLPVLPKRDLLQELLVNEDMRDADALEAAIHHQVH